MIQVKGSFVKNYFKKRGYKVIKISFTGRSYVGLIVKNKQKFFFKFSKNKKVARAVFNEYIWNKKLNSVSIKEDWPVHIPKIFDSCKVDGLFWFITEYFNPKNILSDPHKRWIVPNFINKYLDNIINFLFILPKIKIKLPNDKLYYSQFSFYDRKRINDKIMCSANNFAKRTNYNCNLILRIIKNTTFDKLELNHLDIKPWHFFKYDNRIALVDSEWVSNKIVKYYDVASFYSRVYVILGRLDIANRFLEKYYKKLPQKEKDIFKKQIRALVGWISMGELRDAILKKKLFKENYSLIKRAERNKIFNF